MYNGNKGEWSELYVLLKLLADGFVIGADEKLNKVDDWIYPVQKIIRESFDNKDLVYEINNDLGLIKIVINDDTLPKKIQQKDFVNKTNELLSHIKKEQSGSFEIPELNSFLNQIKSPKMKAGSGSKRDLTLVIKDHKNRLEKEVGFSIKSKLGGSSTLFNASKATNFVYNIIGLEELSDEQRLYALSLKAGTLVKWLNKNNCRLVFENIKNSTFLGNLKIIDSLLDKIMAQMVIGHYLGHGSVKELVAYASEKNPCDYDVNTKENFYTFKVKQFLLASALGMTPTKEWIGNIDATGGYMIVKEDGELVCYHIYNWNALQDYLYNSTKLETASTSRHDFGKIYIEDSKYKIDLNLQVRFK